jgi:tetratricopeptide (TPR) repeat protein
VIRSIAVWFCGVLALAVPWGMPAADWTYDPKIFAFLPDWCKYTPYYTELVPGGRNREGIERLTRTMGVQNWRHIHHYCRGLSHHVSGVYFARTKRDRDRALAASLGEYDYVIQRVEPSFALLPEILTKKGESLVLLGQPEAIQALGRAISLRPDYWPAYAALSDYYQNAGNLKEARQWLQKGLVAAPEAKPLAHRLAELDKEGAKAASR